MSYIDEIKKEVEKCTDIVELIDFIENCKKVAHDQKQLARQSDDLHNQAIEGIKLGKKRLKELSQ